MKNYLSALNFKTPNKNNVTNNVLARYNANANMCLKCYVAPLVSVADISLKLDARHLD